MGLPFVGAEGNGRVKIFVVGAFGARGCVRFRVAKTLPVTESSRGTCELLSETRNVQSMACPGVNCEFSGGLKRDSTGGVPSLTPGLKTCGPVVWPRPSAA